MRESYDTEEVSRRLLYDDEHPRLRRPINPTVLKLRRPTFIVLPLVFILACAVSAFAGASAAAALTPLEPYVLSAGLAAFMALVLVLTLLLARREEKSFALLLPNAFSVSHALLLLVTAALALTPSLLALPEVAAFLAALPGPDLDEGLLPLAKGYIFAFLTVTGCSIAAVLVFRVLGLRRVPAEET